MEHVKPIKPVRQLQPWRSILPGNLSEESLPLWQCAECQLEIHEEMEFNNTIDQYKNFKMKFYINVMQKIIKPY